MTATEKYAQMIEVERAHLTAALETQYDFGSVFSQGGSAPGTNTATGWADMTDGGSPVFFLRHRNSRDAMARAPPGGDSCARRFFGYGALRLPYVVAWWLLGGGPGPPQKNGDIESCADTNSWLRVPVLASDGHFSPPSS